LADPTLDRELVMDVMQEKLKGQFADLKDGQKAQ
jgi:hypothetical protein